MSVLNLMVSQPTGVWESIIMAFESGVGSFAVAIILLTLCIRFLWLPFDFYNKRITRKNAKMQQVLAPQLDKIKKQYGSDKNVLNQKVSELYKKNNFNMFGSCAYMLVFMALNLFIFITLFGGLNNMSAYKIAVQYEDLKSTYATSLYYQQNPPSESDGPLAGAVLTFTNEQIQALFDSASQEEIKVAIKAVEERYEDINEGFLWVANIWKADSPFTSSIPNFDEYASIAKLTNEQKEQERAIYDMFMNDVRADIGRVNGYFIMAILAVGISLLSTWLMNGKINKTDKTQNKQNKFMLILMPLLMGIFAIFYNSVFALYMVCGQVVSIVFTPLINFCLAKLESRDEKKRQEKVEVIDYRRK